MRQVKLSQEAEHNLKEIFLHIAIDSYVEYAERQITTLLKQCDVLTLNPRIGSKKIIQGNDVYFFPVGRVNIYYQFDDEALLVLSFHHSRKKPDDLILDR